MDQLGERREPAQEPSTIARASIGGPQPLDRDRCRRGTEPGRHAGDARRDLEAGRFAASPLSGDGFTQR